ncbi:MAG: lactonase family protein [Proteobacteria bacterium]|nr:lactonase family protein [Pseudomonadota bacterium]MBS0493875.1 lactonase family protein [Pseudomonadota bacterium]
MTAAPLFAYVGSRTTRERNARGDGITVFRVDEERGTLDRIQTVDYLTNPSFLALNAAGDRLYTVHGDGHEVCVLAVDQATGKLPLMQTQDCGGRNPVHLAIAPDGRHLVVSDHLGQQGGTVVVLPIAPDGLLGPVQQRMALPGEPGPHRKEQPFAKPHFNPFDPGGRFVLVPDKGLDKVFIFAFEDGQLTPAAQPWLQCREGAGPRHLAFHPTLPCAYVVNELDSTILACGFDAATGRLQGLQILSTLPEQFVGNSRAAEIEVSRDGRHVYASNRGADSIAVFDVDAATGRLCWRDAFASAGRTPRFFTSAPLGRHMYVLNEDSDDIACFALDDPTPLDARRPIASTACGSPVCMVFSAPAG